jgi:sugar/nucleoside kinase (ribokinase family)
MSNLSQENKLSQQLIELFDMKKAKVRNEELLTQAALEAQKEIRLLTLMFRDGIPDIVVQMSEEESIKWDSNSQQLVYINGKGINIVDATSREVRVSIRPHLAEMVKKAKNLYL